jgi:hypothetical protein
MDEQVTTAAQVDTATADQNSAVESTTTSENSQVDTNTSEQQKKPVETKPEATESKETIVEASKTEETKAIQTGAPEKYGDFTVPEGFTPPIEKFTEFAKANNWTQEQAQSAVDFYTKEIAPQMQTQHQQAVEKWTADSKKEFGKEGIEAASKALGRFSTPEFKQFLDDSGLGNHPEMVRIFKSISDKISDAGFIDGVSFYGNSGPEPYPDLPQNRKK